MSKTPSKRLLHELQSYQEEPNPALKYLGPISDSELMTWEAGLKGIEGTAYQGGLWTIRINIPPNYPLAPPSMVFKTPICHPNVHFKTGEVCLDLLKSSWSPAYTISSTLTAIHQLLTSAEPDSPLNVDIAMLLRAEDQVAAESLIRFYSNNT